MSARDDARSFALIMYDDLISSGFSVPGMYMHAIPGIKLTDCTEVMKGNSMPSSHEHCVGEREREIRNCSGNAS